MNSCPKKVPIQALRVQFVIKIPAFKVHKQTLKIGSFIGHGSRKALTTHVHRLNDTLLMTAVGQQRAAAIN